MSSVSRVDSASTSPQGPTIIECPYDDTPSAVVAGLRGRHDVGVALDRPSANQHLPVNSSGRYRKGRRDSEHCRAVQSQLTVQFRESKVETDTEAEVKVGQVDNDELAARRNRAGLLVVNLPGNVNVEEVALAVGREYLTVGSEHDAGVVGLGGIR